MGYNFIKKKAIIGYIIYTTSLNSPRKKEIDSDKKFTLGRPINYCIFIVISILFFIRGKIL